MPKEQTIKDILRRSTSATCAFSEKELTVKSKEVVPIAKKLKKAGYFVIGTSYGKTPTKKIWFIKGGGF